MTTHGAVQLINALRNRLRARLKVTSLRKLSKATGVNYCALSRFSNGKQLDAVNFLKLEHFLTNNEARETPDRHHIKFGAPETSVVNTWRDI